MSDYREAPFYDAEDFYTDLGWYSFRWRFPVSSGYEYHSRAINSRNEILRGIYAVMPQADIMKEIMGDVTLSPDFSGWEDAENWKPVWDTEWKVTSTMPATGSPTVLPFSS